MLFGVSRFLIRPLELRWWFKKFLWWLELFHIRPLYFLRPCALYSPDLGSKILQFQRRQSMDSGSKASSHTTGALNIGPALKITLGQPHDPFCTHVKPTRPVFDP
ncbi:unnamed protein product [Cuscuta europaea]|uniref:Uncharacterized protein n=1 Tax=Cuscuta europaea TaxID=41803 RepID=A0A9P1EG68_CUSEU|nr:unnamed protein product [Cuscuta europaea]